MKKMKKIFALLLSFVMIMGMAVTANAATIVSNTQDASVMTITSSTATVSYDATTVSDVTRYSYYLMMPKGDSISSVPVSITMGSAYPKLKVDGTQVTSNGTYEGTLDFSNGTKTFVASDASEKVTREFKVTAGVKGTDLQTVYVRVDVRNAVKWLEKDENKGTDEADEVSKKVAAIKEAVPAKYAIGNDGIMTAFVPVNLKAGATAMDALKAACTELKLEIKGSDTYVEAIGTETLKLEQKDTDRWSGWMYLNKTGTGNFEAANYGAASYNLVGGEYFAWIFVNTWDGDETGYLNTK